MTSWITRLGRRLRMVVTRRRLERDMDDEMRLHLELEAEELVRSGIAPDEAWRQARLAFGGVERFKEEGREARGVRWADHLRQDARYGLRQLRRSPGFTIAVVITLSLGIGAATAMYSIVRAVFVSPFPFDDLHELVFIEQCGIGCRRTAIANFRTVQAETRTLSDVSAIGGWSPVAAMGVGAGGPHA